MFTGLLSFFSTNKYLIIIALVLTTVTSGYVYYLRTSAKIESLEHEKETLTLENTKLHEVLALQEKSYKEIVASRDNLIKEINKVNNESKDLVETLNREKNKKKSLEELAIKKTSLIEKKVNAATQRVLECFETLTKGGDC